MKWIRVIAVVLVVVLASHGVCSEASWSGEYANEKLLKGQAAFQLNIEQSANTIEVSFSVAYVDGHGAAPDGGGPAKMIGKETLEFKWEDSFNNSGTGQITRADRDVILSMRTTQVVEPRCLAFYGTKMRLKRVK